MQTLANNRSQSSNGTTVHIHAGPQTTLDSAVRELILSTMVSGICTPLTCVRVGARLAGRCPHGAPGLHLDVVRHLKTRPALGGGKGCPLLGSSNTWTGAHGVLRGRRDYSPLDSTRTGPHAVLGVRRSRSSFGGSSQYRSSIAASSCDPLSMNGAASSCRFKRFRLDFVVVMTFASSVI